MKGLLLGTCRNCGAEVSCFARSCPGCGTSNLPNPIATITVLLAVILIGGAVTLGVLTLRGSPRTSSQAASPAAGEAGSSEAGADDYGWIVKAMAECDEEAKIRTDTMFFLIVPVASTSTSILGWSPTPIGPVGRYATLLSSTDALIGLRNRVMALYRKPLAFAVSDPATQAVFKWKPAVGVTSLKTRDTGAANLTLGFEFSDVSKEIEWGPTINLNPGTCYWINLLVRSRPRSETPRDKARE